MPSMLLVLRLIQPLSCLKYCRCNLGLPSVAKIWNSPYMTEFLLLALRVFLWRVETPDHATICRFRNLLVEKNSCIRFR